MVALSFRCVTFLTNPPRTVHAIFIAHGSPVRHFLLIGVVLCVPTVGNILMTGAADR